MRQIKTTPSDDNQKSFFSYYSGLVSALVLMGIFAQCVSFFTEIGGFYASIHSVVVEFNPIMANTIAIIGAVVFSLVIELGLRKLLPYSVKSILYKKFNNMDGAMTFFITLCCLVLIWLSGSRSFMNSKVAIDTYLPEAETVTTAAADSLHEVERLKAYSDFRADSLQIADRYKTEIAAVKSSYKSKVAAGWQEYRKWTAREKPGVKYTTKKNQIQVDIKKMEAERDQIILDLQRSRAQEIKEIADRKNGILAYSFDQLRFARDSVDTFNGAAIMKREGKSEKWGNVTAYFTIFCLIVFIISVVIDEIYKKGSGIEERALPGSFYFAPSIAQEFWAGLNDKIEYNVRLKVANWFEPSQDRKDILPKYGKELFDYSDDEQKIIKLGSRTNKKLMSGHARKGAVQTIGKLGENEVVQTNENPIVQKANFGTSDNSKLLSDNNSSDFAPELSERLSQFDSDGKIDVCPDNKNKVVLTGPLWANLGGKEFDLSQFRSLQLLTTNARMWFQRANEELDKSDSKYDQKMDTKTRNWKKWLLVQQVLDYYGIPYWPADSNSLDSATKITFSEPKRKK